MTIRVANLTQKRVQEKLSLIGLVEVENIYIASVIYYRLTVFFSSASWLTKRERFLLDFLWRGRVGLDILWLMMHKHALRLQYIQHFINGDEVWLPFIKQDFPQLVSLTELQSWIERRPWVLGSWSIGKCPSLLLVGQRGRWKFHFGVLWRFNGEKNDDGFGETLDVGRDQLTSLFRRAYG